MVTLENLIEQYFEATRRALEAVRQEKMDLLAQCLDHREQLINQIDDMCRQTGERSISEPMQIRISQIKEMDQELISAMNGKRDAIQEKISAIRKGKQLRNQYTSNYTFADGVFFDKRK